MQGALGSQEAKLGAIQRLSSARTSPVAFIDSLRPRSSSRSGTPTDQVRNVRTKLKQHLAGRQQPVSGNDRRSSTPVLVTAAIPSFNKSSANASFDSGKTDSILLPPQLDTRLSDSIQDSLERSKSQLLDLQNRFLAFSGQRSSFSPIRPGPN